MESKIKAGDIVRVTSLVEHERHAYAHAYALVEPLGSLTDPEWERVTIEKAFRRCAELGRELWLMAQERSEFDVIANNAEARVRQLEQAAIGSDAEKVRVLEEQATAMGEQLSDLTERLADAKRDRDAECEKSARERDAALTRLRRMAVEREPEARVKFWRDLVDTVVKERDELRAKLAQKPAEDEGAPRAGYADPHAWAKPGVWTLSTIGGCEPLRVVSRGEGRWATGDGNRILDLANRRPATDKEAEHFEAELARKSKTIPLEVGQRWVRGYGEQPKDDDDIITSLRADKPMQCVLSGWKDDAVHEMLTHSMERRERMLAKIAALTGLDVFKELAAKGALLMASAPGDAGYITIIMVDGKELWRGWWERDELSLVWRETGGTVTKTMAQWIHDGR